MTGTTIVNYEELQAKPPLKQTETILSALILSTPTGKLRNTYTHLNLLNMLAQEGTNAVREHIANIYEMSVSVEPHGYAMRDELAKIAELLRLNETPPETPEKVEWNGVALSAKTAADLETLDNDQIDKLIEALRWGKTREEPCEPCYGRGWIYKTKADEHQDKSSTCENCKGSGRLKQ